jgi:hypothetical protein
MRYQRLFAAGRRLLTVAAFLSLVFVVGCDEHVQITRDRDVRIPKHATWAWLPASEQAAAPAAAPAGRSDRPVTSRDVIGRNGYPNQEPRVARDVDAENDVVRGRVKSAIEQTLASKGFQQVGDPGAAEFLVDYKFAVRRHNETVPAVYGGGYPGLVCGPFRCWEGWGWGPTVVGYENIHFREGTIVFDLVQAANKHQVYRAIGEKPVRRDAFSLTQGDINGLTHLLLEDLKTGK